MAAASLSFVYKIRILFLIMVVLISFFNISRSYYSIFKHKSEGKILLFLVDEYNNSNNIAQLLPVLVQRDSSLLDRPLTTSTTTTTRILVSSSPSSSYGDNSDTKGHRHHRQAQGQKQKQRQTMTTIHQRNNSSSNNNSNNTKNRTVNVNVNDKNSTVSNNVRNDDTDTTIASSISISEDYSSIKNNKYDDDDDDDSILISRPNDDNTAIILVAMGNAIVNNTWLTERCVRSIRKGGQYNGYIIIITDKEGYIKYTETLVSSGGGDSVNNNNNNKVIVIETKNEDISPKNKKNGSDIRYYKKRTHMLYKRYKTLAIKYLEYALFEFDNNNNNNNNDNNNVSQQQRRSSSEKIEHALYLDVDNIVAQPLSIFFNDYYNSINIQLVEAKRKIIATATTTTTTKQQQQLLLHHGNNSLSSSSSKNNSTTPANADANADANANANANDFSFFSFWKDPHVKHKGVHLWQSGQIMFSTKYSSRCLDAWRYEMDNNKHVMDQAMLFNVYIQNFTEHRCLFFELPNSNNTEDNNHNGNDRNNNNNNIHGRKHFQLFSKDIAEIGDTSQYPTIVHLTKMRLDRISQQKHHQFLRKSLLLDDILAPNDTTTTTTELKNENDVIIKRNNNNKNNTHNSKVIDSSSMTNVINWNNQTISWNEIIESFDGHNKEKKIEKKKKKRNK